MEGNQAKNQNAAGALNQNPTPAANLQPNQIPNPTAPTVPANPASQTSPAQPAATPAAANQSAAQPSANPQVAFKSADIGVKTAVKEDPFALQNQRAAAKKQQAKKDRKKLYLIVGIVAGVAVLALLVISLVLLFNKPQDAPIDQPTASELEPAPDRTISAPVEELSSLADEAYQANEDNPAAAEEVFNDAINNAAPVDNSASNNDAANAERQAYVNQVQLAKVMFYAQNGYYHKIIENESQVQPDTMTARQRATYYNMLYLAYYENGDTVKAEEYMNLATQAAAEAGGHGSGEE